MFHSCRRKPVSRETAATPITTSPKIRRRQSRTRQRILDTSAHLFVLRGFANVSVEEILKATEVARSSFYRFFSNREEVLTNIIRPVFEQGIDELRAITTTDPKRIIESIFDTYLDLWEAGPDALRVSTRIPGKHFYLFEDVHDEYRNTLTELVMRAEPTGILLNGSGAKTARLIARTAVPVMEVYAGLPDLREHFHRSMNGFLLRWGEEQ